MGVAFETNPILSFVAADEPRDLDALQIDDGSDWEEYCQVPAMNGSTLWHANDSMKHLKEALVNKVDPTPPMKLGTVTHTLLLEPTEFEKRFCVMPDFQNDTENLRAAKNKSETDDDRRTTSKATRYYKRKAAQFFADARESNQEVVTREQYDTALAMIESVRSNRDAVMWLDAANTRKEVTVVGEIEGVVCKGRVDILNPNAVVDLKSAKSNDQRWFGRFAYNNGYLFKQSIHRELVRQMTGQSLPVYYIVVENSSPFDCSVMEVEKKDEQIFDQELERCKKWLREYRKCLKSDVWPGRDRNKGCVEFWLPDYAMDGQYACIQDCEVVTL